MVRFVTLVFLINYSIFNAFTKTNSYFFPSELIYFAETSSNAEVMNEEMEERYFRVYQNANTGSSIFEKLKAKVALRISLGKDLELCPSNKLPTA